MHRFQSRLSSTPPKSNMSVDYILLFWHVFPFNYEQWTCLVNSKMTFSWTTLSGLLMDSIGEFIKPAIHFWHIISSTQNFSKIIHFCLWLFVFGEEANSTLVPIEGGYLIDPDGGEGQRSHLWSAILILIISHGEGRLSWDGNSGRALFSMWSGRRIGRTTVIPEICRSGAIWGTC